MRDFDQPPTDAVIGAPVLNMFARAKTGQLSLMGTVEFERPAAEVVEETIPADEELAVEQAA